MNPPLAHLRFPLERSRGRRYPELPHAYRSPFQRDRDRVIHARAFRRLENKTQVFAAGISDHFRNRLTHTIEVAQIARTAAGVLGLDEDLTEALALVHDIGHPPFGHAGEHVLDEILRGLGDRFDHNQHALHIVESFEIRYARFPGLNLTFEVREGIVKHSRDLIPGQFPDLDEYLPHLRPPLEAQLIDLCDEIAYDTADLDDAYHAGLITLEDARAASAMFAEFDDTISSQYPGASERVRMHEVVRALINWLVSGLIEGTIAQAKQLANVDSVRQHPARVVAFTPERAEGAAQLKRFLRTNVYESGLLMETRQHCVSQLRALFDRLMRQPELMPAGYREQSIAEPPHRQVSDYIAGMTDGFFARTCSQLGIV